MFERVLFLAAAATSVGYFAYVVSQRLAAFAGARDDLSFDDLGGRLRRVVSEVLFQRRVLRDRPWAGLLHALVLWGFFAFAWVSIEHVALGVRGLKHAEADGSFYGWFAAVWAIAVLIGILGLAFRRFVLRPASLGAKLSGGSAIVAVLIVVLMATYLAGWRGLETGSAEWRWNWWAHTAALLGMLWVIPNSKHLHLVLGPIAVFFRSGDTTSSLRPLDDEDDDDFGMLHFSDLSRKDVLDVHACVECGRCSDVCPARMIGGVLDPKQIALGIQHGLMSAEDRAASPIAGTAAQVEAGEAWISEEALFECYTCGACEQACPVGIEHVGKKILDLRRGLVSEGRTHNDKLTELFTTMERSPHNAWGASRQTRDKVVASEGFPIYDGSQELLLWLGCGLNYDPHGNDVARAMKKVLDAGGLSWGVLEKETCCGEPARRAGNEYLYLELSEKVVSSFAKAGVREIVVCDPHCCRMFDDDYRSIETFAELGVRVRHHTELLAELAPRLPLERREETLTYHDPCYLARGRGQVDAPRIVLETIGADLVELPRHGERTQCCGAGGAQLYIADDRKEPPGGAANDKRFAQIAASGVDTVAAACPYCPIMINDAAGRAARGDLRVADVAELVAERLS